MKKAFFFIIFISILFSACGDNSSKKVELTSDIQHTVMFNLKHEANSAEEKLFLEDGQRILSTLPTVKNFEVKRQISSKNEYKFYFTMLFEDEKAYEAYNSHPEHVKFVKERWETEVIDFLEADFINYSTTKDKN
ncbi:Dabb family protein [Dysgonomonas sp. Marseille-P4361]|uniref:Dabb family protein n=1 Tax=Dysgonomonas sp. Marseille-P4361 TaxID=2161820 RepID=UPI000D54C715|nr:Dabb family protein [Dysgonomonas sp. Marseille-P4361]